MNRCEAWTVSKQQQKKQGNRNVARKEIRRGNVREADKTESLINSIKDPEQTS